MSDLPIIPFIGLTLYRSATAAQTCPTGKSKQSIYIYPSWGGGGVQGSCRLRNVGSEWPLTCFRSTHMWSWLMEKHYGAVCNVAAGGHQRMENSLRKRHFFIFTTVKLASCVLAGGHVTGPSNQFGSAPSVRNICRVSSEWKPYGKASSCVLMDKVSTRHFIDPNI